MGYANGIVTYSNGGNHGGNIEKNSKIFPIFFQHPDLALSMNISIHILKGIWTSDVNEQPVVFYLAGGCKISGSFFLLPEVL